MPNGRAHIFARSAEPQRIRYGGWRRLSHLFRLCARRRRHLGHAPVARPRSQRAHDHSCRMSRGPRSTLRSGTVPSRRCVPGCNASTTNLSTMDRRRWQPGFDVQTGSGSVISMSPALRKTAPPGASTLSSPNCTICASMTDQSGQRAVRSKLLRSSESPGALQAKPSRS